MTLRLHAHLVSADKAFAERVRAMLLGRIECSIFAAAQDCQAELARHRPDLVMIDFSLPNDGGLELHRNLRDDFDFSDLYQLALCGQADFAREGFAPDDFLILPAPDAVFLRKMDLIEKVFADKAAVREQMAYAQNVAFTSMSAMGELGVVMQFLSKSFTCHNVQSVASLAVESLRQYELEGAIYLVWEGDRFLLSTGGESLPGDCETLIAQRRPLGRLLEIERNLSVNFEHVSILVTNLPQDDAQRLGRIRDNIATLAEGVESRVQGLLLEHDNLLKQQGIRYAVSEIRDSVINLDARQTADLLKSRELVNQVIDDFEQAFLHMGMHSEQENLLIGDLVALRHKLAGIVGQPGEAHEKLKVVIAALETLAGEVNAT
jgi:CheY-like chemotaxis protein